MTAPVAFLTERLGEAAARLGAPEDFEPRRFVQRNRAGGERGDVQVNAAFALAKTLRRNPAEIAAELAEAIDVDPVFAPGPLAEWATAALRDPRLGVPPAAAAQTVVVDYSAPNVAKEMHVGHLRSTVIGDALVRALEFEGHAVIRANHLGDWGTQFGMLTQHMLDTGVEHLPDFAALGVLYRDAKDRFDGDPAFRDAARARVVALQSGDPATLALWRDLVAVSLEHINDIYRRLDVTLTDDDVAGESFYNPRLADTVAALEAAHVASESDGAVVVASRRFTNQDGSPAVLIVRKSDGGYGYAVTDLAAVRHRTTELRADRLIYVTDARQGQHFAMVFDAANAAGWMEGARAEHVPFGTMLGADGKPFKTRTGGTVALSDLLDDAIARARTVTDERSPELPEPERAEIARIVGIGAVKYADLSTSRQRDLLFSFDRMLALDGNTAPYMLYACVRAAAIAERAGATSDAVTTLTEPAEKALVLALAGFGDAIADVTATLEPHRLCTYVYELAGAYSRFYESCPVLDAATPEQRASRLGLCALTAATLGRGLGLLGIGVPARM